MCPILKQARASRSWMDTTLLSQYSCQGRNRKTSSMAWVSSAASCSDCEVEALLVYSRNPFSSLK